MTESQQGKSRGEVFRFLMVLNKETFLFVLRPETPQEMAPEQILLTYSALIRSKTPHLEDFSLRHTDTGL